jgi:hypothetical protein
MRTTRWILMMFCLLGISVAVSAQTTGNIRGEIKDPDGGPIPGATITITSDALIGGSRISYSNEAGVFRFPAVPLGTYTVEVTMEGFGSVRAENVSVKLDSTAFVPLTLKTAARGEEMTILGETPIIDPTDAGLSTSFKSELLKELPTQRGMWDLMQVSPGVTTTVGDSQSTAVVAFGSNIQSNSWNIDGVDVTGPETGGAWYFVNPDLIEEVQVIGVGAPAEYGNHTGAVLNIVTKKGGNDFHGTVNYFTQTDGLTGNNIDLPDSDFGFHRDKYHDFTTQIGGPILKDRLSFFGAFEYLRDASTPPGADPAFAPLTESDKYDLKISGRLGEKHEVTGFYHNELYAYPGSASQFSTPSSIGVEEGDNPAWGASIISTLSDNLLLEGAYSGWTSDDFWLSATGSLEDPFTDFDVFPETSSGGVAYPYDYLTSRHQFKGKVTYYADKFLKSEHEFRFGVQYNHGVADTLIGYGANGIYLYQYYGYLYRISQTPYEYGGISDDFGVFVDDTVTVKDRLTLNLGVRFDYNKGSIPEYDRLAVGTPSITHVANWVTTGEKIPGQDDLINWKLISPRLGLVYQLDSERKTILDASFGVYYDHNVIGNWDAPPPGSPPIITSYFDPSTEEWIELTVEPTQAPGFEYNRDLKPPKVLQYAVGLERQILKDGAVGVSYVYKDTKDLIGWEITGGVWEPFTFVDPLDPSRSYTLFNLIEQPIVRKGNDPGNFPGSEGLDYFQKYHGVILTFEKRFSSHYALNASYTWSRSTGLLPRMISQSQFSPFYGSREGSDPNNFINAEGRLQGDRPHLFRVQGVFFDLPGGITASTALEFSSGRAHSRLARVRDLGQGTSTVIMDRIGTHRFSPIKNIDVSVGKVFHVNDRFRLRADAWVYNLLNSDQELNFTTLVLSDPSETFVSDLWAKPRRLQLRVGLEF